MRKILIAIAAGTALTAVGATAFAAQPSTSTGDELFAKANTTTVAAETAEPLKGVDLKKIRLGDDESEHGIDSEHGEHGEGMDD